MPGQTEPLPEASTLAGGQDTAADLLTWALADQQVRPEADAGMDSETGAGIDHEALLELAGEMLDRLAVEESQVGLPPKLAGLWRLLGPGSSVASRVAVTAAGMLAVLVTGFGLFLVVGLLL